MAATIDLVQGSVGVVLTVKVTSSDPGYVFADVTGARVELRRHMEVFERVADSFAVVSDVLHITYTTVAEDTVQKGTIYVTGIAERPAGDLFGEERSLLVGR